MRVGRLFTGVIVISMLGALIIVSVLLVNARARAKSDNSQLNRARADLENAGADIAQLTRQLKREAGEREFLQMEVEKLKSAVQRLSATSAASAMKSNQFRSQAHSNSITFKQFTEYASNLRNSQFGRTARPLTPEELQWLKDAQPYFKELQRSPEQFAEFQIGSIQSVLGLQDQGKVDAIRQTIEAAARKGVEEGVMYSQDPSVEGEEWKKRRHELDRAATRAVQELLTGAERELFDRRFLGVLIFDLTPGRRDPAFEFIDPSLGGVAPKEGTASGTQ